MSMASTDPLKTGELPILLVSPEDPDADSVSSMFAFREYLRDCKPRGNYPLFAPNPPRRNTLFECLKPLGNPYTEILPEFPHKPPTIVIAFDYGQFSRTRLIPNDKTFYIGFDHHPPKAGDISFPSNGLEICDPTASSTTALLYRFFNYAGFKISQAIADCLLVGLLADTGKFTNSLTTPEALETGAALMRCGGNHQGVLGAMRFEMSAKAFATQLKARDNIVINTDVGIGFLSFSKNDLTSWGNANQSDILPLQGLLQNIKEVRLAVVYYEREDGAWYGSLRSSPKKGVNVKNIAQKLGGGGHDYAAGFVSNEPPEVILKKLQEFLTK
ncbi:MAG: DHHA1 domain-containing protein [bacterium]|nr:DHHA1 domain-containing protein [bacterium]